MSKPSYVDIIAHVMEQGWEILREGAQGEDDVRFLEEARARAHEDLERLRLQITKRDSANRSGRTAEVGGVE